MRILISGASGFVGNALCNTLQAHGHHVTRLIRKEINSGDIFWSPEQGFLKFPNNAKFDIVFHLAGENISKGLWTKARKERILSSRVESTRFLIKRLSSLKHPPHTFISASAIGYYGHTGEEKIDESCKSGVGFLADVCRQWEETASMANQFGMRTVFARFGVILGFSGGIMDVLQLQSKTRLNIIPGLGEQYISWTSLNDTVKALEYLANNSSLEGAVNLTAPHPVKAHEFYGRIRKEPPIFPGIKIPASLLKLGLKDMANGLFLDSCRAIPKRLLNSGFTFEHQTLSDFITAWKAA